MTTILVASTLIVAPFVAIAWIGRRLRSSIEELAWRLVVIALLLFPIAWYLPKVDVGFNLPVITTTEVIFIDAPPLLLRTHMPWFMLAPSAILLTRLACALVLTRKLTVRVPVVVGLVRPAVVLPPDASSWSCAKRDAILAHESAHIRRRDPLWRFLAQLAIAVFWFHPAAWLAAAALERLSEEAADRDAIAATGDRRRYAEVLLDVAASMTTTNRRILAAAMLDRRSLARRIDAILDARAARRAPWLAHALLIAFAAGSMFITAMTKNEIRAPALMNGDHHVRDEIRTQLRETLRSLFRFH